MGRLVDADALGNRLYHEVFEKDSEDQRWDSGCWMRYRLFEKVLREQPTVEQPERMRGTWIPLSEKFPQKNEDVLLQFPSNQCVGYYEDGDWMINTGDGICSMIGYDEEKPIAWMPLPEPYKRGEEHE